MQTSDENEEKYRLWDYLLIRYQILQSNIMRIVWWTVGRITYEILGFKELISLSSCVTGFKNFPFGG